MYVCIDTGVDLEWVIWDKMPPPVLKLSRSLPKYVVIVFGINNFHITTKQSLKLTLIQALH